MRGNTCIRALPAWHSLNYYYYYYYLVGRRRSHLPQIDLVGADLHVNVGQWDFVHLLHMLSVNERFARDCDQRDVVESFAGHDQSCCHGFHQRVLTLGGEVVFFAVEGSEVAGAMD